MSLPPPPFEPYPSSGREVAPQRRGRPIDVTLTILGLGLSGAAGLFVTLMTLLLGLSSQIDDCGGTCDGDDAGMAFGLTTFAWIATVVCLGVAVRRISTQRSAWWLGPTAAACWVLAVVIWASASS